MQCKNIDVIEVAFNGSPYCLVSNPLWLSSLLSWTGNDSFSSFNQLSGTISSAFLWYFWRLGLIVAQDSLKFSVYPGITLNIKFSSLCLCCWDDRHSPPYSVSSVFKLCHWPSLQTNSSILDDTALAFLLLHHFYFPAVYPLWRCLWNCTAILYALFPSRGKSQPTSSSLEGLLGVACSTANYFLPRGQHWLSSHIISLTCFTICWVFFLPVKLSSLPCFSLSLLLDPPLTLTLYPILWQK